MRAAELAKLVTVKGRRGAWIDALCPGHDDHAASFSFRDGDARVILTCRAGCSDEQIAAALGISVADLFFTPRHRRNGDQGRLTLDAFAAAKGLPRDFLAACGVEEHGAELRITYRLADGSLAPRQRRRWALVAKDGSAWTKGAAGVVPYGLEDLDAAREKAELLFVEGETDRLTAKFHRIPCLGIPGADMAKLLDAEHLRGIETVSVLREPGQGGATFVAGMSARLAELGWQGTAAAVTLPVKDLNDLHRTAGADFAAQFQAAKDQAVPLTIPRPPAGAADPAVERHGDEVGLRWAAEQVAVQMMAFHATPEGLSAECAIAHRGVEIHWGRFNLLSTPAREAVVKKLAASAVDVPWRSILDRACRLTALTVRQGEPLVTLTGAVTSPTRVLLSRLLYEGEPTLIYADGDTGKSLCALTIGVAVHAGVRLPCGLQPARRAPVAYLDWEASRDTHEARLGALAAGLGIDPPGILYKRMSGPLVQEARMLAAEFSRRGVGLVIIDSQMFAVAAGEGAGWHEPITAFYNTLRLFAPAASLVLNHIINADARSGMPGRPFGGAFSFNGPRLIWEARRDREITDATAIVFTCKKANNIPRRPHPFGLRFKPGTETITVYPFKLTEAAPQAVASVGLRRLLWLALEEGPRPVEALAEALGAKEDSIRKTLGRYRDKGFVVVAGTDPQRWARQKSKAHG